MKNTSISVMVSAYNEEKHLENTINHLHKILRSMFKDYEIIIFDDGSRDNTPKIADNLAEKFPNMRVVHNKKNMGNGYNFRLASKLTKKEFFSWVPGDDETEENSLNEILSQTGESDIIITYTKNPEVRKISRRIISKLYTIITNLLFGLNVRYYNGIPIYRTELLKKANINTNTQAFLAEIAIQLIKQGYQYKEVPMCIRKTNKTNTIRLTKISAIIIAIIRLFIKIHFQKNH